VTAFAGDHSSQYRVGIFSATAQVNDGTYAYANDEGTSAVAYEASHNVHYVRTSEGMWGIEPPTDHAKNFKQWFMDQLNEGDKVLFAASCDKHNNCTFWVPNPDKPGKEFKTSGNFRPNVAKTNTQSLCGKGKLRPEIESQVCHTSVPNQQSAAGTYQPSVPPPTSLGVWTDTTDGTEFKLRKEGDNLYATGFTSRMEIRRGPDGKWRGKSLGIVDGDGKSCTEENEIEIDLISDWRIEGVMNTPKAFDIQKCVGNGTVAKHFVLIRK
jgi:hypothetical protein